MGNEYQKKWIEIVDAITDYIFITSDDGIIIKANNSFAQSLGCHPREIIGRNYQEIIQLDIPLHGRSFQAGRNVPDTVEREIKGQTYLVSTFPLMDETRALTVTVMKNITEMKKLKDRLIYSDRLVSIGRLVGGIAHELNNPMTGILAYAELLKMSASNERMLRDLDKILTSAERCKKIIENLLAFSRQSPPMKSRESIHELIDSTIELRSYWLRHNNIEVVRNYGDVPLLSLDVGQIKDVFYNLLINAEQAIAEMKNEGGRIVFKTWFDSAGGKVVIEVSDNGPGIPKAVHSRVFDPFFTTKPVDIGTGLGLSTAYGIITEHGGSINAGSSDDHGALFVIELPAFTTDQ